MSNEVMNAAPAEEQKKYSPVRYAFGAVLAFFGISSATHRASKKRKKLVGDIVCYIVLLFGAFLSVYPFWWMVAAGFADTSNTAIGTTILNSLVWWPRLSTVSPGYEHGLFYNYSQFMTKTFQQVFGELTFWRALGNNLVYSIVPVVVGVITSASAAFSFAKLNWYGRDVVFFILLAAIMVPRRLHHDGSVLDVRSS